MKKVVKAYGSPPRLRTRGPIQKMPNLYLKFWLKKCHKSPSKYRDRYKLYMNKCQLIHGMDRNRYTTIYQEMMG